MTRLFSSFCVAAIVVLIFLGCSPIKDPEFHYYQIKNLHLRIPFRFAPWDLTAEKRYQAPKPPGLSVDGIYFREQDTKSFERFIDKNTGHIWFNLVDNGKGATPLDLPWSHSKLAWEPDNRNSKNDIYGLMAFRNVRTGDDYMNYRFNFMSGNALFISCTGFNFPRPICHITTTWRGLQLRYMQSYSELNEWRDLHTRLTTHFDSFIYEPQR